jgi:hypothetical protein
MTIHESWYFITNHPSRITIDVIECFRKGNQGNGYLKKSEEHIEWSLMGEADVRSGR